MLKDSSCNPSNKVLTEALPVSSVERRAKLEPLPASPVESCAKLEPSPTLNKTERGITLYHYQLQRKMIKLQEKSFEGKILAYIAINSYIPIAYIPINLVKRTIIVL